MNLTAPFKLWVTQLECSGNGPAKKLSPQLKIAKMRRKLMSKMSESVSEVT